MKTQDKCTAYRGGGNEELSAAHSVIIGHRIASSVALAFGKFGRLVHRGADPLVRTTPADVGDFTVNLAVGGVRVPGEQSCDGHNLARLTVATLWHIVLDPGALYRMRAVRRQTLNSGDLAVEHGADRQHTGAHCPSIDMDSAGTALRNAAAVLCASQANAIAQDPQQRSRWLSVGLIRFAIHAQGNHCSLLLLGSLSVPLTPWAAVYRSVLTTRKPTSCLCSLLCTALR